jgi:hypothetical protein
VKKKGGDGKRRFIYTFPDSSTCLLPLSSWQCLPSSPEISKNAFLFSYEREHEGRGFGGAALVQSSKQSQVTVRYCMASLEVDLLQFSAHAALRDF